MAPPPGANDVASDSSQPATTPVASPGTSTGSQASNYGIPLKPSIFKTYLDGTPDKIGEKLAQQEDSVNILLSYTYSMFRGGIQYVPAKDYRMPTAGHREKLAGEIEQRAKQLDTNVQIAGATAQKIQNNVRTFVSVYPRILRTDQVVHGKLSEIKSLKAEIDKFLNIVDDLRIVALRALIAYSDERDSIHPDGKEPSPPPQNLISAADTAFDSMNVIVNAIDAQTKKVKDEYMAIAAYIADNAKKVGEVPGGFRTATQSKIWATGRSCMWQKRSRGVTHRSFGRRPLARSWRSHARSTTLRVTVG